MTHTKQKSSVAPRLWARGGGGPYGVMLIIGGFLLVLQGVEALLNGGNLLLGVALLLALALHHGLGGVGHEVVVRELLLHTRQEALQVLQVLLELGYLGIHIDEVAYRNGRRWRRRPCSPPW